MSFKALFNEVEFLTQYPMVGVAISNATPSVPGYLYGEINAVTYVDNGKNCKVLVSFLVSKLQACTPLLSIKVLKLLLYLIKNGHKDIIEAVKFHEVPLKQAMTFHGVQDVFHGNAFYEEIRKMAKELLEIAFSEKPEVINNTVQTVPNAMSGYGSSSSSTKLPGFGFSIQSPKSMSEKVADGFTNLVEKILPVTEKDAQVKQTSHLNDSLPQYKPLIIDKSEDLCSEPEIKEPCVLPYLDCPLRTKRKPKVHRPGRPGGGWADSDDENDASSILDSEDIIEESSVAVEPQEICKSDLPSSDWSDELKLVQVFVINEPLCKLDHTNILSFCKSCSTLNCDQVISFLVGKLSEIEENTKLRALVFIEYLLFHDVVNLESLMSLVLPYLKELCKAETEARSSVKLKAKKVFCDSSTLCFTRHENGARS